MRPQLPAIEHAREIGTLLQAVVRNHPETFAECFTTLHCGKAGVSDEPPELVRLVELGVCRREGDRIAANFRVTVRPDLLLLSDTPSYTGSDRVWYPLDDESTLFADHLPDCRRLHVLDVGCGSGILGLTSARNGARRVTAVDVSPRAVAMTSLNSAINGLESVVEVHAGDIASLPVPDDRYDLLLLNPPFVPLPEGTTYMLSGAGGADGLAVVHATLRRLHEIMSERHGFAVISMSPGDEQTSLLERLLLEHFRGREMSFDVIDVYGGTSPIERGLVPFRGESGFERWRQWLEGERHTHLHYLLIRVMPAPRFSFERRNLVPPLAAEEETGTWDAMYRVIENSRRHAHS